MKKQTLGFLTSMFMSLVIVHCGSAWEFITDEYVDQCAEPRVSEWQDTSRAADEINEKVRENVLDLEKANDGIRKDTVRVSKNLQRVSQIIHGKDLRRVGNRVLSELDKVLQDLNTIEKAITENRQKVDASARTVGDTYCILTRLIEHFEGLAQNPVVADDKSSSKVNQDTANHLMKKQQKLAQVMDGFDNVYAQLNQILETTIEDIELMKAVQHNIVGYIDDVCSRKDRMGPQICLYDPPEYLNVHTAKLTKLMARNEQALANLAKIVEEHFQNINLEGRKVSYDSKAIIVDSNK